MAHLGLSPSGVTDYLLPGGADRQARDGLDERLHHRFRRDPPEFVTVLAGGTDGLHFGLWYDDPAELPSFVVYNHARDSAETSRSGAVTLLGEVRRRWHKAGGEGFGELDDWLRMYALEEALDWFADADSEAFEQDGVSRWAEVPRTGGSASIGPALPPGSGDQRAGQAGSRLEAYRGDPAAARRWIDEARAELATGQPAFALVVGAELHWLDSDTYRRDSLELLTGAYRALGRDALAEIVEVHLARRDLRSVDVLT